MLEGKSSLDPELPAPGSLLRAPCLLPLSTAELSSTLKIFSGTVLSSASSLASISVCNFSFLVPAYSPLLPCPSLVLAWICLLSLSWCTWDPCVLWGVLDQLEQGELEKHVPIFLLPALLPLSPGLCSRLLSGSFLLGWWAERGAHGGILPSAQSSHSRWC